MPSRDRRLQCWHTLPWQHERIWVAKRKLRLETSMWKGPRAGRTIEKTKHTVSPSRTHGAVAGIEPRVPARCGWRTHEVARYRELERGVARCAARMTAVQAETGMDDDVGGLWHGLRREARARARQCKRSSRSVNATTMAASTLVSSSDCEAGMVPEPREVCAEGLGRWREEDAHQRKVASASIRGGARGKRLLCSRLPHDCIVAWTSAKSPAPRHCEFCAGGNGSESRRSDGP